MLHLSSIFQDPSSRFCPSFTKKGNLRGKSMAWNPMFSVIKSRLNNLELDGSKLIMETYGSQLSQLFCCEQKGLQSGRLDDLTRVAPGWGDLTQPEPMLDQTSSGSVFCCFFPRKLWENCSTPFLCHPFRLVGGRILSGRNADNWSMVIAIRQAGMLPSSGAPDLDLSGELSVI